MLPIIDLHCDTLSKLASNPERFLLPQEDEASHISFSGLCRSGAVLQCFALFTDLCDSTDAPLLTRIWEQVSCFHTLLSLTEGRMAQMFSYSDFIKYNEQNKISALLTLEESCLSAEPLSLLPEFYTLGVRMATLTWNYPNLFGCPAFDASPAHMGDIPAFSSPLVRHCPSHTGLTPFGFDFVAEAERLGILIDVSHLSDAGFYDVAACSKKPFLASHSNARSLCNVPRNLSDDMLRTIGARGGVVGLNLHEPFLVSAPVSSEELPDALVRHAKHILSVAGTDTLAIGTDFDGIPGNAAIPDVTYLPLLADALKKAGLTSGIVEKIFYRNALRLFKECL